MQLTPVSGSAPKGKGIAVTIMYHRVTRQVLFLEAGKDFVDLVMGFLTLPLGSILKLFSESAMVPPKTVGGIFNVFESIPGLEAEMCVDKSLLMNPQPSSSGLGLRRSEVEPASRFYYTCTAIPPCSYVAGRSGTKCPRHLRKMTTQCALIEGNDTTPSSAANGYVKNGNKFFITDTLEIFPSSKSLVLLQKLKVENMSLLESLDICIGTDEVLQILRGSLTSASVLSEVFGKVPTNGADTHVLASLREMLSHSDNISSMSYELLKALGGPRTFKEANAMDPHHRERKLCSTLQEIDHAFQARLAGCVGDREVQISSALSAALQDVGFASSASSELTSSRFAATPQEQKEELEKQVDKVVDKLCQLAICVPPATVVEPPLPPLNPKPQNRHGIHL